MTDFKIGGLTLAAISMSLAACAAPAPAERSISSALDRDSDREEADDDEPAKPRPKRSTTETTGPVAATAASPKAATATATPKLSVTFAGSAKQNFAGMNIARVCSDRGAEFSNATFIDGTSLQLISVDYPDRVLASVNGAAFQTLKAQVLASGQLELPVNPGDLPDYPVEFAIVMGGDDRFGSPAACGKSLKPGSTEERDIEEFPSGKVMLFGVKIGGTGCGIVGFVEAYYDQVTQKVIAKASSQLLLAADDEGRGGFPSNSANAACDGHDSPLVLDLANRGVALSAPMSNVFDVDGDGVSDDSPWVVSDETPFLVRDANGNGVVDGVDEMFGNRTRTPSGLRSSQNGFEALALWDTAGDGAADGVIDEKDGVWASLRLWFDRNHDGRTDPGELETLESRGVRSIALSFVPVKENLTAFGHVQGAVRQRGGATMTDGRVVNVVDVWFQRRF